MRKLQKNLQQKIVEHELAEEKIQQQHQFLQQVINSLEHPFYVINTTNYQIELANSFMHKLGFQPQITCHALTHNNPKPCTGESDPCPLEEVKRTKKPVVLEHIHFDKDGKLTKMIEYSLNITKRKLAEQKLNQQNEQLKEKNEQLNAFALQLKAIQKEKLYKLNKAYGYFVPRQF